MAAPRPPAALGDAGRERLQALIEALPAPLEPLDISALDGWLVGVLLQPQAVPEAQWLAGVLDAAGRAPPAGVPLAELYALVRRRHAELAHAIGERRWFDPWVFELEPEPGSPAPAPSELVLPWLAGWAAALEAFPDLLALPRTPGLREALATLYRHFDADDLEDDGDDELAALIDALEPPADSAEAVEDLVRCTLLLADETRPRARAPRRR
ncbi:MAG TPA: UPF0149 family protein [Burkholderiaceae bacterium]|nr:UPF0149 family protein [Burkholderiaceae bacterium]